eukprot:s131_g7.t1
MDLGKRIAYGDLSMILDQSCSFGFLFCMSLGICFPCFWVGSMALHHFFPFETTSNVAHGVSGHFGPPT